MRYRKKLAMIACCVLSSILFASSIPLRIEAADNMNNGDPVVTVTIPVSCEKEDTTESFRYQLQGETSRFEHIETRELELKAGEKGTFSVSYNYPGTYHYTVSQVKGTDEYTTYDETVYNVDAYVTENDDGALMAELVAYTKGDASKKAELVFKNIRKAPSKNNTTNGNSNHKRGVVTGDTTEIVVWLTVLIITGAILIFYMMNRRHKRRRTYDEE